MFGQGPRQPPQAPPAASQERPVPTAASWAREEQLPPHERAGRLRPGQQSGTSGVPFQVVDRAEYLASIKGHGSIAARTHDAPIALVNLRDLHAIQQSINDERLAQHLDAPAGLVPPGSRAPGHGGLVDRPVVVKKDGRLFLHDGHHRLTAAHLRGQETAKVRLVDLDGDGAPDAG